MCRKKDSEVKDLGFLLCSSLNEYKHLWTKSSLTIFPPLSVPALFIAKPSVQTCVYCITSTWMNTDRSCDSGGELYFSSLLSQQRMWQRSRRIYLLPALVRCQTRRWWVEWRQTVSTHLWSPSRQLGILRWLRLYLRFASGASTALLLSPVKPCPSSVSEDQLLLSLQMRQKRRRAASFLQKF